MLDSSASQAAAAQSSLSHVAPFYYTSDLHSDREASVYLAALESNSFLYPKLPGGWAPCFGRLKEDHREAVEQTCCWSPSSFN